LLLAGCGSEPKTAPVSGRVTLDNKPLANATLQFVPASEANTSQNSAVGTTGEDGRYSLVLNSNSNVKGALVGKYKVIITLGTPGAAEAKPTYHKQLPERYNRKSQLECAVPVEGRDDADFNLTSR
jgi:hypothetical protein